MAQHHRHDKHRRPHPRPRPQAITSRRGTTYRLQRSGDYRSDDGNFLNAVIVASLLSGRGHDAHDYSPGETFTPGGGSFGGGGAQSAFEPDSGSKDEPDNKGDSDRNDSSSTSSSDSDSSSSSSDSSSSESDSGGSDSGGDGGGGGGDE